MLYLNRFGVIAMTHPTVTRVNEINERVRMIVNEEMATSDPAKILLIADVAQAAQKAMITGLVSRIDSGMTFDKWYTFFLETICDTGFGDVLGNAEFDALRAEVTSMDLQPYYDEVIVAMVDDENEVQALRDLNRFLSN